MTLSLWLAIEPWEPNMAATISLLVWSLAGICAGAIVASLRG